MVGGFGWRAKWARDQHLPLPYLRSRYLTDRPALLRAGQGAFPLNESGSASAVSNRFRNYRVRDSFINEVRNEEARFVINLGCNVCVCSWSRCRCAAAEENPARRIPFVALIGTGLALGGVPAGAARVRLHGGTKYRRRISVG